jgi:hypothetical protein
VENLQKRKVGVGKTGEKKNQQNGTFSRDIQGRKKNHHQPNLLTITTMFFPLFCFSLSYLCFPPAFSFPNIEKIPFILPPPSKKVLERYIFMCHPALIMTQQIKQSSSHPSICILTQATG